MTKNTEVTVQHQNQNGTLLPRQGSTESFVVPTADIYESPDAFVIMLDMPGSTKESIGITIDRSVLIVKGEVQVPHKADGTVLQNEISGLSFHRAFNLGENLDPANVDARYEDGVLTMKLYKKEEEKPREIQIQ
jgi:HSP20 family protein